MAVTTPIRSANLRRRVMFAAALVLSAFSLVSSTVPALSAGSKHRPKAHAAASYLTGVADEHPQMFSAPLWKNLHTRITRYVVPYDAAVRPYSLTQARNWINAAEAQHQQVLIAFYHSEYTPTRMPSVRTYEHDTKKFIKLFPHVQQYQPWNETNRGNIRYAYERLNSPTAVESAKYYQALKRLCPHCTILGLDILDQNQVGPTLTYIAQFQAELRHLRVPTPRLWGLHNYSDTNRFSSQRTRTILRVVPGNIWLTETGGIVKFGGAFPNRRGSGLARAARALNYMFAIASSQSRVKRLYIYEWSGGTSSTIFDSGLTDARHRPRPGYMTVCARLHGSRCSKLKVSSR